MELSVEEKLARSLTADDTDIIPFLPYLLQDLWELGSSSAEMIQLLENNDLAAQVHHVLDLGCGKGAVSIPFAETFDCSVKGIDLLLEFIEEAERLAQTRGLSGKCEFLEGDINQAVVVERNYDCVIFGAVGNVLGDYAETLNKLKTTLVSGGLLLWADALVDVSSDNQELKLPYEYLTFPQWQELFEQNGMLLVDHLLAEDYEEADYKEDYQKIACRADELSADFPENQALFTHYKSNQLAEFQDLEETAKGVLWLLKKR